MSAYLSNNRPVGWVRWCVESIGLFFFLILWNMRAHLCVTMCAVLFVSLYINVYVCASCCVYKYIHIYIKIYICIYILHQMYQRFRGLQSQTITPALSPSFYFGLKKKKKNPHPGSQSITTCLLEALVLTASRLGPFVVFHNEALLLQTGDWLTVSRPKWRQVCTSLISLLVNSEQDLSPVSRFPLYAKLLYVCLPFHHNPPTPPWL